MSTCTGKHCAKSATEIRRHWLHTDVEDFDQSVGKIRAEQETPQCDKCKHAEHSWACDFCQCGHVRPAE